MEQLTSQTLGRLEPIRGLSGKRLDELAAFCRPEHYPLGIDPFRVAPAQGQLVYLLNGELKINLPDGGMRLMVGGCDLANWPLGYKSAPPAEGKAITDIDLVRIDADVLDLMMTWDELSSASELALAKPEDAAVWRTMSGAFSVHALTAGGLGELPPAHLQGLLRRFERVKTKRGQVMVREGDEGDYYYLIESGRCEVLRSIGGSDVLLAELKAGAAFGEEALVSNAKRNATVRMKTDGVVLRLAKPDFIELLRTPLLHGIARAEAERRVALGKAVWLDVRYAVEFASDGLPGAINIPLNEIRTVFDLLDRKREYIVYCQSGRRSSTAAFLLAQHGFNAFWLEGGLAGRGGH
ncbi:MAG: rhodanese-like protein,cyclic nucleotide-binding protein [Rhodocyclaceae bacterium]|nr:rhodanese-like protein,cyclic nucleotide-binding protein [Rhodocyclaceae bacterium]